MKIWPSVGTVILPLGLVPLLANALVPSIPNAAVQMTTLEFKVTEYVDGTPVEAATVRVFDIKGASLATGPTDKSGVYRTSLPAQTVKIEYEKAGYIEHPESKPLVLVVPKTSDGGTLGKLAQTTAYYIRWAGKIDEEAKQSGRDPKLFYPAAWRRVQSLPLADQRTIAVELSKRGPASDALASVDSYRVVMKGGSIDR